MPKATVSRLMIGQSRGFTLMEVVVSWFLLSVALLALLKLDQTSVVSARAALWQALAQSQRDAGLSLLAVKDQAALTVWQREVSEILPQGQATFQTPLQLSLRWQPPELDIPLTLSYPTLGS